MDAITDNMVWQLENDFIDQPGKVYNITGEFYDQILVSRWSQDWLAGDQTWVIGITKGVPFKAQVQYGLVGRTVHILADLLKSNDTLRFGLIDYEVEENLKTTLIGQVQPRVVILK